jgi:serine protease Do
MSTFARGALAGVAVSAAIGASLVAFTPTSFRGTPALAKEKGELWHEHAADAAAQPVLAKGFSPLPSVAPLVKGLKPAVVSVSTANVLRARRRGPGQDPFDEFFRHFLGEGQRPDGNGDRVMPRGMGSGFVIHESGLVLTNNHVIDGADQITVKLADGREFRASVVGRDPKTDVAILKIQDAKDLPTVVLGNSDALEVGDWVIAIGNPFGLWHSVSMGIVSAKERFIGAGPYDDFIQTDAAINPGNSGGPLFNAAGEVIGINTAIVAQGQGIGFAVPINLVKALVPQLEAKGTVSRGWLGVAIQDMSPDMAKSLSLDRVRGALIAEVVPGSPADKAGIKPGDVVLSVDGKNIESYNQLSRTIALYPPGAKLKLQVLRDGKENAIQVAVAEREEDAVLASANRAPRKGEAVSDVLGLQLGPVTPEVARSLGLRAPEGVLVTQVKQGGPADAAGVANGDVILEVNRRRVRSLPEYTEAARTIQPGDMVLLRIQRGDSAVYVALRAGAR